MNEEEIPCKFDFWHESDSDIEDTPVYISTDVVSAVDTDAFPVSAEVEYLYGCGLPYAYASTIPTTDVLDRKALSISGSKLRQRITTKGRPRKLHKYEIQTIQDDNISEYESLLTTQCGPSTFRKEPDKKWEKLSSHVYKDSSSQTFYYRCSTNNEFGIRIPKVNVVVELRSDEIIQSVIGSRGAVSHVPTLSNMTFRPLYNQAIMNKEEEIKHSVAQQEGPKKTQELHPITSFIEENPIQRAIRLAKEKYRNRKGDGEAKRKSETITPEHENGKASKRKLLQDSPVKSHTPRKKSRNVSDVTPTKKSLPKFISPEVRDDISRKDISLVSPPNNGNVIPMVTNPHLHQAENVDEMSKASVACHRYKEEDIVKVRKRCEEKVAPKQTDCHEQGKGKTTNLPKLKNGYKEMSGKAKVTQSPPRGQKLPATPTKTPASTNEKHSSKTRDHSQVKAMDMPTIFDLFSTNQPPPLPPPINGSHEYQMDKLPSIFDLLPSQQREEEISKVDEFSIEEFLILNVTPGERSEESKEETPQEENSTATQRSPPCLPQVRTEANDDQQDAYMLHLSEDSLESPPMPQVEPAVDDDEETDTSKVGNTDSSLMLSPVPPVEEDVADDEDFDILAIGIDEEEMDWLV